MNLREIIRAPDDETIEILEKTLERAKCGEIVSIAVVAGTPGGDAVVNFGGQKILSLLGAIYILGYRVTRWLEEE